MKASTFTYIYMYIVIWPQTAFPPKLHRKWWQPIFGMLSKHFMITFLYLLFMYSNECCTIYFSLLLTSNFWHKTFVALAADWMSNLSMLTFIYFIWIYISTNSLVCLLRRMGRQIERGKQRGREREICGKHECIEMCRYHRIRIFLKGVIYIQFLTLCCFFLYFHFMHNDSQHSWLFLLIFNFREKTRNKSNLQ